MNHKREKAQGTKRGGTQGRKNWVNPHGETILGHNYENESKLEGRIAGTRG